jgi:hypothetical protein
VSHWIKSFLEALDDEHRTMLITFFNSEGCMDWCYQRGSFYQLSGPEPGQWADYFKKADTNMMVRAVTWWDDEPLWDGTYDDVVRVLEASPDGTPSPRDPEKKEPPSQSPETGEKSTSTHHRSTVRFDRPGGTPKQMPEDSSATASISDAYLQRKAGSVPYLYVDPQQKTPYWIGRQEPCDTIINDQSLSRKHCHIVGRNGDLVLVDNGSANGSYVNEQRVEGEMVVKPGDLVRVGRAMFILRHPPESS